MTSESPASSPEPAEPGFSFTDKRRIDPETGKVRASNAEAVNPDADSSPSGAAGAGAPDPAGSPTPGANQAPQGEEPGQGDDDLGVNIPDDASDLDGELATEPQPEPDPAAQASAEAARYLDDLQRLNAEYAAYRRRTEREQERAHENGVVKATEALIPLLDEVRLATEAGDVTGPFEKHVEKLFAALGKLGVEQFGAVGEVFDPTIHEALMQQPSEDATEPTVFLVMQPGYRLGERVLRAARVGVHTPVE